MMGDLNHEPSMEEILSSIKRIIAEDSDAALSSPRPKRAVGRMQAEPVTPVSEPEVLELTETAEADVQAVTMVPPMKSEPATTLKAAAAAEPAAPLVSDQALSASRSSLAALSALIVKPDVAGSDTLEGLVRDMLKPMLAQWLDTHLAAIVERQVAQEIARITARG